MKVADVMSKKVRSVLPSTSLRNLWEFIFTHHIKAIPVVDTERKLKGIISREDLLKSLFPDYQEFLEDVSDMMDFEAMEKRVGDVAKKKASDVMSVRVIYTRDHTPIMRALSRMIIRRVDQLPVLSTDDRVIGIVTKGDIFYALAKKSFLVKTTKKLKKGRKSR